MSNCGFHLDMLSRACKKHREIWTQCLIDFELDPAAKSNVDTQMLSLVRHMMSMVCTRSKRMDPSFSVFRFRAQANTIWLGASLVFKVGEFL